VPRSSAAKRWIPITGLNDEEEDTKTRNKNIGCLEARAAKNDSGCLGNFKKIFEDGSAGKNVEQQSLLKMQLKIRGSMGN